MMPRIGVLISNYEGTTPFLRQCVGSVLGQRVDANVEILVRDDGSVLQKPSNDDVSALVDHGVIYIPGANNIGLAASLNILADEARTEFILPLDADDWLYPGAIKALLDGMDNDRRSRADCVVGDLTQNGVRHKPPIADRPTYPDGSSIILRHDWRVANQSFATTLMRKSKFDAVGGYGEQAKWAYNDYILWIRMWKASAVWRYVPELIYEHRLRPDSMLSVMHAKSEEYKRLAVEAIDRD